MNKLKDVAGLLKAKITKDELEEALINATSQQNWQTSTHILHEIANAAYNYEKWQQINDFIWDKLKKGKSWKKILKTLNLVQFLLKNGPPSIISSFKYDIYQFRSFDNFSHYDDGIDRGESIRERAKVVVDLLSNEELLEEERVKAKTIRERMSGIVSGSNYGGFSGSGSSSINAKYGSIDNKSYQTGGYSGGSSSYNEGGLGVYGDYNVSKSTLDKYKDNKTTTTSSGSKKLTTSITTPLVTEEKKKQQTVVDNKKPFQTIAPKLVKPGSKPAPKQESTTKPQSNKNIIDDDILGGVTAPQQETYQQPKQQEKMSVSPPVQTNTSPIDLGFSFDVPATKPQVPQPAQQPVQNVQQQPPLIQPQVTPSIPLQPAQNLYSGMNLGLNNPTAYQQPQLYSQQTPYGYGQQQGQFAMMGGYPQQPQQGLYGQPYQQPMGQGMNMGYGMQGMNFNQTSQYQQPATQYNQQQSWSQGISLSTPQPPQQGFGNISLKTNTTTKKEEDQFGNFASGQNANVKWLTSEEKGLIDFSDFGDELKGGNKVQQKNTGNTVSNNIDTTWTW